MRAVRDGDLSQLGTLFERYHPALHDFLCRMTGNAAVAEDLVQDVFLRVLKYRATFRDEGQFDTWLYRIARNARTDYFRSRRPTESIDEGAMDLRQHGEAPQGTRQNGQYRIEVNKSIAGTLNGGGPEFDLHTFNGDVYLRKGGQ